MLLCLSAFCCCPQSSSLNPQLSQSALQMPQHLHVLLPCEGKSCKRGLTGLTLGLTCRDGAMDQLERLMMVANGNELAQSSSQTMQVPACLFLSTVYQQNQGTEA